MLDAVNETAGPATARLSTNHNQTEHAIQVERDKLNTILNAMEYGVYTVRKGYEIDYTNPYLEKRFGPANGRKCYSYFLGRKNVCPWCHNDDVLAGKIIVREWQSGNSNDVKRKTYESMHIPIKNADGTFSKLAILHDITDRKLAESRLLEYQHQLRSLAYNLVLSEERERRRIACRVHDRIGHSLTSCIVNLTSMIRNMPDSHNTDGLHQILGEMQSLAEETRSLTFEISSPLLYEVGLEAALERLVDDFQRRHAITAVFHDDNQSKPLAHDIRVLVFECIGELLVNAAKHSMASKVLVNCEKIREGMLVSVTDDGVGFDIKSLIHCEGNGFGLFAIRERMRSVGGQLRIESKPGAGSKLILQVPLEQTSA